MPITKPPAPVLEQISQAVDPPTKLRFVCLALGLLGATVALAVLALSPPTAGAFGTFSNGTLTIPGGEGKIVPRCDASGEITVSGASVDDGPFYCRDLRRIVASSDQSTLFDFSQLPDDLGGGQGPIEIQATSTTGGGAEFGSNKFIGAAKHINIFTGGGQSDLITGGDLNDTLNGGGGGDKLEGGKGSDTLRGGPGGDKLLGGPGRDILKGGAGSDLLVGGPGKDVEQK
jgi:Ca2+-binding RTX toxin-like protein